MEVNPVDVGRFNGEPIRSGWDSDSWSLGLDVSPAALEL